MHLSMHAICNCIQRGGMVLHTLDHDWITGSPEKLVRQPYCHLRASLNATREA